jgi:prephenate dehydrogenase
VTEPAGSAVPADLSTLRSVLVAGTGLMGTSAALALRTHGVEVYLADRDPAAARLAADLGAGRAEAPTGRVDLGIIAVPPTAVARVLGDLQHQDAAASYTDLASTKSGPQREIEAFGCRADNFVGGHPLAGRERSGPGAARADLFEGRPWVLTPSAATDSATLARGRALARLCGATPVVMTPEDHDRAVALVSHAPQLVASLVAARLLPAADEAVQLAGQGVRDVTRIAASDPGLWQEILGSNATAVADVLDALAADLTAAVRALRDAARTAEADQRATALAPVVDALRRGNAGRARIPGKHGQPPAAYSVVPVVVSDQPGQLAQLFADAGAAGVNIEDVAIEHSPGQPVGYVELFVRPAVANDLAAALTSRGWAVHG